MSANLRGELRNILNLQGYQTLTGESLTGNSPYNPFGRTIHLRGQRTDLPRPYTETEVESLDMSVDLSGYFNAATQSTRPYDTENWDELRWGYSYYSFSVRRNT